MEPYGAPDSSVGGGRPGTRRARRRNPPPRSGRVRFARALLAGQLLAVAGVAVHVSPAGQRIAEAAFGVTVIEAPKRFEATAMTSQPVLVLGDSLSNLGADAITARFAEVPLKIDARNGRNMSQGLERMLEAHQGGDYAAAIVALGTNDIEVDRAQTAAALDGLMAELDEVPCVLLLTVQNTLYDDSEDSRLFGQRADEINDLLRAAAEADPEVHIVEFGAVLAANPSFHDGMIDAVHLNATGSQALADAMRSAWDTTCAGA